MLVKMELAEVPVLPCPPVEITQKKKQWQSSKEWAMTAQVVQMKRSGRVLVADFYLLPDQRPYLRFACDGINYCTAEHPVSTWTQKGIEGYLGYSDVFEAPDAKKIVSEFFGSNLNYRTATREMDDFCSTKMREKRWRAADSKEDLMRRHFAMYPALPENLPEYCNRHIFRQSYVFYSKIQKHGERVAHCSRCGQH